MDTVLFNFHDLVLILTAFECILFAALIGVISPGNLKTALFAGFLVCHALIPMHELVFWGERFRFWMLELSPNLFFIGSYAYFIDGALLFLFVNSLLIKNYRLHKRSLLHLIPILAFAVYMAFSFYNLSYIEKWHTIESQHIAYSAPYLYVEALGRFIRLGYALACVLIIFRYTQQLKQVYGFLQHKTLVWLKVMVFSILILFSWDAALLVLKVYYLQINDFDLDLLEIVGTGSYHLTFIALNLLIFMKFSIFQDVRMVDEIKPDVEPVADSGEENTTLVAQIEKEMREARIYRNADLTLDQLSEAVKIPARKLSQIIKTAYGKNFYEFVNAYRVEEAKRLLVAPEYRNRTIMEVYLDAGFNSKSVFNTFFKKLEKMTPSQYKKLKLKPRT